MCMFITRLLELLRKKYGDVNGQIPGDLKIVKTYDTVSKTLVEEQFFFETDGLEFFGIPSLFKVNILS